MSKEENKEVRKRKSLIVVASNKGGVGKTFTAKMLYQAYIQQVKGNIIGVDVDIDNRTFSSAYPDIIQVDFKKDAGRKKLAELATSKADVVLMDFMGGSLEQLRNLSGFDYGDRANQFLNFYRKRDYDIKVIIPVGNSPDGLLAMSGVYDFFGNDVEYFLMRIKKECSEFTNHEAFFTTFSPGVDIGNFKPYEFAMNELKVDPNGKKSITLAGIPQSTFDTLNYSPFSIDAIDEAFTHDIFLGDAMVDYFAESTKRIMDSGIFN